MLSSGLIIHSDSSNLQQYYYKDERFSQQWLFFLILTDIRSLAQLSSFFTLTIFPCYTVLGNHGLLYLSSAVKALFTAALLSETIAHPGHDLTAEIAQRDLTHCSGSLRKRDNEDKQRKRRQAAIESARAKRGLPQSKSSSTFETEYSELTINSERQVRNRDLASVTNFPSVNPRRVPYTPGAEEIIFSNSSCILSEEGEVDPFWLEGEYIRSNITESEPRFDIVVDAQFIDTNTCDPIPGLMWDLWHCNATGVYGGVIGSGNGNEDDTSKLNKTFLRGLQPTDGDGVAQFESIFPGHYAGRATHMHVLAHINGTTFENGTYAGGAIPYIDQLFSDQDLITEVNLLSPYVENTIAITENVDDRVVISETETDADPVFNYVLLGDTVDQGLFMWIDIGIDATADYVDEASAAAELTADGGVEVTATTGGGGNATNGTAPSDVPTKRSIFKVW
jgi:protocatechuate 3,4-dioxygenase beta subunit